MLNQIIHGQLEKFNNLLQQPPADTPKLFLTGVSERVAITSDNKEIYYNDGMGTGCFKFVNGKWTGPENLIKGYGCPSLSSDDKVMFVQNNKPDIWYLIRNTTGWSEPRKFWSDPATKHYLQLTNAGNCYLSYDLKGPVHGNISKIIIHQRDTIAQSLGAPINSLDNGIDFYVSRDESYIIFVSHPGGVNGDLYISFRLKNESWSNPEKLNILINSSCWEWGPFVTNDNHYLFFTRGCPNDKPSIYWVEIEKEINSLRSKVFKVQRK